MVITLNIAVGGITLSITGGDCPQYCKLWLPSVLQMVINLSIAGYDYPQYCRLWLPSVLQVVINLGIASGDGDYPQYCRWWLVSVLLVVIKLSVSGGVRILAPVFLSNHHLFHSLPVIVIDVLISYNLIKITTGKDCDNVISSCCEPVYSLEISI